MRHLQGKQDRGTVVIVWKLDLQLPVKSVTITTYFVSSIPTHGQVYLIQHFVHKFISDLRQVGGFLPGTPVSSTNRSDRHDILGIWNIVESGVKHHNPTQNSKAETDEMKTGSDSNKFRKDKLFIFEWNIIDIVYENETGYFKE